MSGEETSRVRTTGYPDGNCKGSNIDDGVVEERRVGNGDGVGAGM